MGLTADRDSRAEAFENRPPRFGSYIGLFYIAAILGILCFAVFHDAGTGHAHDQLKPGMTPTEVAALLGVPRSETKSGTHVVHVVQVWRIPDGFTIEVEFQDGKLLSKARVAASDHSRSGSLTRDAPDRSQERWMIYCLSLDPEDPRQA